MSDTLATLTDALKPKTGMKRIAFATEAADLDSPVTGERLVNLYAQQTPTAARSTVEIRSSPGLTESAVRGTGPIHAMNAELPGRFYLVSGDRLFKQTPEVASLDMGSVGTTFLPYCITIAMGPTTGVVCVPPRAYAFDVNEAVFHQLGGDFPGASSVAYLDGYFVFTAAEDSSRFFVTGLFDADSYDALDFAYADRVPNVIRRVIVHRGQLWFMGEAALEIWYDSGDADFPLRPQAGGVIPFGCLSPRSIATGDGSVFWLGQDRIVYRSNGQNAVRISSHSIEAHIREYLPAGTPALGVVCAFFHTHDGHGLYTLTLQTAGSPGRSLVYDCATKLWHERSSADSGNGRWRPNACVVSGGLVFGDSATGKLMTLDPMSGADVEYTPARIAVTPPLWGGTYRAFCNRVEIEMQVGGAYSPGPLLLEWSDDGGVAWPGSRTLSTGTAGEVRKRVATNRLGSFRQRMFRITTYGRVRIFAMDADIGGGTAG